MIRRFTQKPIVAASALLLPIAVACSDGDSDGDRGATSALPNVASDGQQNNDGQSNTQGNSSAADMSDGSLDSANNDADTSGEPNSEDGTGERDLTDNQLDSNTGSDTGTDTDGTDTEEVGAPVDTVSDPLETVEDSGLNCETPNLPPANQLPNIQGHPDPFLMTNGTRISTKAEWTCRRAEIKAQVEQYESGPKPFVDTENVTGAFAGNQLTIGVSNGDQDVAFTVNINRPNSAGTDPVPLLIGIGGSSLDNSVFSDSGVATANLNNNAMGAQAGGGSRGNGIFYDLYGNNHPASSMIAWAWGVSRIIDALEKTPEAGIDASRIAVTGCSRNGKGALTAGAFDERIVLTIPQESGAGGSASWRVSQDQSNGGENVQTLSSAAGEQPWFRANFGQNFGGNNVTRLPFDHHTVMGMVAPRALLVIDNRIDWLGIDSTFTAGSIANEIWQAFGEGDSMGYWQTTGHTHCAYPASQRNALVSYVNKFLVGDGTDDTNLVRGDNANADLGQWMDWTAPALAD